ncbi:Histone deacetylation protein Rxt3 [Snodgrassella alvi SCGC AB-598-O02]|nr:Histone deacetylation protein Rxt3 [Snodgrassella alvi SCGC AB-598-O02]
MTKQQEIKAAFCKGLEAFLLAYRETEATVEVIKGYVNTLNNFISEISGTPLNEDDAVYIEHTYTDDNDTILITAHQGSESVKLAAIKRGNAGAFTEFIHIGSAESITVKGAKDIENALFKMLEAPPLITILYRLICQSHSWRFNNFDYGDKLEAMIFGSDEATITSIPEAIEYLRPAKAKATDSEIEEVLNQFLKEFNEAAVSNGYQFLVEQSNDAPDEFSIVLQGQKKATLIKLKAQNGTYPVTVKCGEDDPRIVHDKDRLEISLYGAMMNKSLLSQAINAAR